MNRAVDGVIRTHDFRERFVREGLEPVGGTPEAFGRFLRDEIDKYAKVIKFADIPRQ
jgi:tripartite-type tricarboxylate transporter receptor subunit TctC